MRGTILAVVDPLARELTPIRNKHKVAAGLLLWTGFGLLAVIMCWWPHLYDYMHGGAVRRGLVLDSGLIALGCTAISGFGASLLITPHRNVGRAARASARIGVLAYVPLMCLVYFAGISGEYNIRFVLGARWLEPWAVAIRLAIAMLGATIVLGLRPNARVLVARSLALRSGRVDRQTLLAMALAAVVAGVGYLVWLLAMLGGREVGDVAWLVGLTMVGMGSALFALGLAGSLIDSIRIARAILGPNPTLTDVIEGRGGAGSARNGLRRWIGGAGGVE